MTSIYKHTDPNQLAMLKRPTKMVEEPYNSTKAYLWMVTDLAETLALIKHAIGLAANQIGYGYRIFAMRTQGGVDTSMNSLEVFVNPIITKRDSKATSIEGCLSIPESSFEVERDYEIELEYRDVYFIPRKAKFVGILSYCVQHEIDHLDGKLVSEIAKREIPK